METGNITIGTYPYGATIFVDNILILDEQKNPVLTPVVLLANVGYHDIQLSLDGYCNEFDGVYVEKNENINIFHNFQIC